MFADVDGGTALAYFLMVMGVVVIFRKVCKAGGDALKSDEAKKAAAGAVTSLIGKLFK